ncbi:hypothetical protein HK405_000670, partial [Cladochytrium tenue]
AWTELGLDTSSDALLFTAAGGSAPSSWSSDLPFFDRLDTASTSGGSIFGLGFLPLQAAAPDGPLPAAGGGSRRSSSLRTTARGAPAAAAGGAFADERWQRRSWLSLSLSLNNPSGGGGGSLNSTPGNSPILQDSPGLPPARMRPFVGGSDGSSSSLGAQPLTTSDPPTSTTVEAAVPPPLPPRDSDDDRSAHFPIPDTIPLVRLRPTTANAAAATRESVLVAAIDVATGHLLPPQEAALAAAAAAAAAAARVRVKAHHRSLPPAPPQQQQRRAVAWATSAARLRAAWAAAVAAPPAPPPRDDGGDEYNFGATGGQMGGARG